MNIFKTRPLLTPWEDINTIKADFFGFQRTIHSRGCFFNQMDVLCALAVLSQFDY